MQLRDLKLSNLHSALCLGRWLYMLLALSCSIGYLCLSSAVTLGQNPAASSDPSASDVDNAGGQSDLVASALAKSGNATFRDTPLAEVILVLSEQWKINIIAGSDLTGQVNGTFKNESLKSILDAILIANGMAFQQIGNSLVVLPVSDGSGNRTSFRVEVLDARVSGPEEMEELITALRLEMSPDGQLVPISSTGKLTILDTPERIAAVKSLLAQISSGGVQPQSFVSTGIPAASQPAGDVLSSPETVAPAASAAIELRPQYILAKDLQESLVMLVGENVTLVENENSIVVFGDEAIQKKAQLLLQQLDKPRAQVRITGYIYDVDLNDIEKLGVDWGKRINSVAVDGNGVPRNMLLDGTGLLTPSALSNAANVLSGVDDAAAGAAGAAGAVAGAATAATGPTGGQFLFRTLNSTFELQALIQAIEQTKGSRLLADPHVTVVDRHKASLGIVTEIPIQQLTQTQQGGSIASTSFRDAGITLDVTPRIAADGTIEMEVAPSFSVLSGFQNGNPIIDTRRASTVVRVNHGQALVIGGLRSKTAVETVKGIPGLMNIKFLGALFRTHDTEVRESELMVFIMPEIVDFCGGLPREMHALHVAQQQLSAVQTAVDAPFTPDCRDPFCPHHHPRPRIHNGMQDAGLIGESDFVFVNPASVAAQQRVFEIRDMREAMEKAAVAPAAPINPLPLDVPPPLSRNRAADRTGLHAQSSSRRVAAKPASYQRASASINSSPK